MKIARKLQLIILLASLMPVLIIITAHGDLGDESFNSAVSLGGVFALLAGGLMTKPLKKWVYLGQIERIKRFCAEVRAGSVRTPLALPGQSQSAVDENELLSLMREVDWMADRIGKRERELRETIERLESASSQARTQSEARSRIHSLLNRFLAPEMVDQLLATSNPASLNKRAELSILFSDIRGFTSLAESMAPEDLVAMLNPYLDAMTRVILANGGTVDKYEGDAVIAFFGEPVPCADHALRAARTAVAMRRELSRLNRIWLAGGLLSRPLDIGIGIHTGDAFVGLLGSDQRVSYTVIGDTVNLASRLQDQTKVIGWPILVSGETAQYIQNEFGLEFAQRATLRGKSDAVDIFKIVSVRKQVSSSFHCQDPVVLAT